MRRGLVVAGWVVAGVVVGSVATTATALTVGVPGRTADRPSAQQLGEATTAPVISTTVIRSQVLTGDVARASATEVVASDGVVTALPVKDGAAVAPGTVVADVDDAPLVALAMPFGLWRDLDLGAKGADVRAVQKALADQDLYTGAVGAPLSDATFAALGKIDPRLGHPPLAAAHVVPVEAHGTRLVAVGVRVGTRLGDATIGVRHRGDVLAVDDGGTAAGTVKRGQTLRLYGEDGKQAWSGKVAAVEDKASQTLVTVEDPDGLPDTITSADVVLARGPKDALAAPRASLVAGADGTSTLTVRDRGHDRTVIVATGVCDADRCAVVPTAGEVTTGDEVVVP